MTELRTILTGRPMLLLAAAILAATTVCVLTGWQWAGWVAVALGGIYLARCAYRMSRRPLRRDGE
jgi:hypothetical protein